MVDLNTLISPASDFKLVYATGINDAGELVFKGSFSQIHFGHCCRIPEILVAMFQFHGKEEEMQRRIQVTTVMVLTTLALSLQIAAPNQSTAGHNQHRSYKLIDLGDVRRSHQQTVG
jgi:hypothetical protein